MKIKKLCILFYKLLPSASHCWLVLFIVHCSLFVIHSKAQQTPQYSLYSFNRILINPAFAGNKNQIQTTLSYRNYLVGIEGAPVTQTLTVNAPIQSKYLGVGLKLTHESLGAVNQLNFLPVISYYIGLGQGRLTFALEGGILHESVNWNTLIKTNPLDNAIPQGSNSKILPDAGFGMLYNTSRYFIGFSVNHLVKAKFDYTDIKSANPGFLTKHYFLEAGYNIVVGSFLNLEPSILLKKAIASPAQFDIGTKINFKNSVTAGVYWRTGDALYFPIRFLINNRYSIAYAYDLRISQLATYSHGSHEIMLTYNYQLLESARKKLINPRYYF